MGSALNGDVTGMQGELDGVADEIPQNLFQFVSISIDDKGLLTGQDVQRNGLFCRQGPKALHDIPDKRIDGQRFGFDVDASDIQTGPVQQLIDDPVSRSTLCFTRCR